MAYSNAPESIKEIYKKILWALLIKMNVLVDEVKEMMGEIGGRGMGYLFENMEKMDIQAERRNTQREKDLECIISKMNSLDLSVRLRLFYFDDFN